MLADLKIQRAALLRNANEYARALNRLDRYRDQCSTRLEARHHGDDLHGRRYHDTQKRQAAAHEREMAKLNAEFPSGAAQSALREITVRIAQAVTDLQHFEADKRYCK